ncbi:MAG: phytoene desaturase family protein [Microscillaceae bacterium]|nr:phytoene desaturase family protein [Microscillaceae bacterium]MDW8461314.1 1-hydroxycarotenoid 3,4-desaturase CrtD [Cytophagales bacterium]
MKKADKPTCVIIGAGIAGIAASIRMAVKGYQVHVLEANSFAGGKLSEFELQGFRFDAGPSLFTMPQNVEELFKIAGKPIEKYFAYKKLEVICHYFYEDGTVIHAFADIERFAQEVAQKTQVSAQTIKQFLAKSRFKFEITNPVFLQKSLHKWRNYLSLSTLKGILNLHRLDIFQSLHRTNQKLLKDERMVQFFDRYATYNGSDPYQTPGVMNVIPHLEFGIGAFFPIKGMYSITQSLVNLAQDLGVRFHYQTQAQRIEIQGNKAIGVHTTQGFFPAECIISNMDIVGTYHKLLPQLKAPQKLLTQPKSSSAIIFYWGISQIFPELSLHNIFFSRNYAEEFKHIFEYKTLYYDPTIYINITSKEKPDDAPAGMENWFVMINAPHNVGQNWDELVKQARANIIQKLNRMLKTNLEPLIVCEHVLEPRTIESRTSSTQGALYGNSSNNRYAAFLRHANFSTQIKNLYFCGGSVHPGGGIPLSLLSAKIATDCVPSIL